MYGHGLTGNAALNEDAPELHILRVALKGMDQREGVFAFVEIFAKPFLRCVLQTEGGSVKVGRFEGKGCITSADTRFW